MSETTRAHFDEIAADYDKWKAKAHYYYKFLRASLSEVVPRGERVCEWGCGTGDVLASFQPSEGLGLDLSPRMIDIARAKHPSLRFEARGFEDGPLTEVFDYVVSVDVAEHVESVDQAFETMSAMLADTGKLVVVTPNPAWGRVLETAERFKMKMPEGDHEWRGPDELRRAAEGAGLKTVSFERTFLVPKALPLLKRLNTSAKAKSLRNRWGLIQRFVFSR